MRHSINKLQSIGNNNFFNNQGQVLKTNPNLAEQQILKFNLLDTEPYIFGFNGVKKFKSSLGANKSNPASICDGLLYNLSLCFTDRFPGIRIPTTSQAIISSTTSTTSSTITSTTLTAASSIKSHNDDDSSTTTSTTTAADDEKSDVQDYLKSINLKLTKWLTKPGRARHMGVAVFGKGG
jgi:hypothetical protein